MTELTLEGKKVVEEVERRFNKRLAVLAALFGIANLGALVAIFIGAKTAAEAVVTSQMTRSVENLQQVVSEGLTELGDAREQVGAAKADLESIRQSVATLTASLETIGPNADKINAAANVIGTLGESGDVDDFLDRLGALETVTDGMIQIYTKSTSCPDGSTQLADFNIQTARASEFHPLSASVSEDSTWDVNEQFWDGRTYRVCLFQ